MDNIADPRTRDLMTIIRQLPAQYAVPLVMRSVLNMSMPEIATYHQITKQAVDQKISKGIELIKQSLLHG
jgi:DNA-directed RNA polymerase specialized sigma24 family protein